MIALYLIGGYLLLGYATFVFYLAVMLLKRERDNLRGMAKAAGYVVFGIGWVLDLAFNLASTIPFADLPRELMFTARVSRLKKTTGWRSKLAHWFCNNLLEPFDRDHCN